MNNNHTRFKDADWYNIPQEIIVGGAGGIGSWLAMFLTRIGHELYIYDDDTIDQTNMGGQMYKQNQIGTNKATSVAANCKEFTGEDLVETMGRYTLEDGYSSPIMITCFDSMEARKMMFENWAQLEERELFLDGRMLAETGMIYSVIKGQEDRYRKELFDDSEVQDAPCSFKATSHCGALISSLLTNALNSYLGNKNTEIDIRILPFCFEFELPLFNFKDTDLDDNRNRISNTVESFNTSTI